MIHTGRRASQTIVRQWLAVGSTLFGLLGWPASAELSSFQKTTVESGFSSIGGCQTPLSDVAAAIRLRLGISHDSVLGQLTRMEREDLSRLYDMGGPLWVDVADLPNRNAREAMTLLNRAAAEGLDPADYGWGVLHRLAEALDGPPPPRVDEVATFDLALSVGMLRYFRHVHLGRVDPRTLGLRLRAPADPHDFVMLLRTALADQRIVETAAELAPPLVQYRALCGMLARYRSLAANTTFEALPLEAARPGEPYEGLRGLHRRLVALGDLAAETLVPAETTVYSGPFVDAVKRFQIRHGLDADGIVGTATRAALQVPLTWRARQIELALERLRWLPDLDDQRFLALNIPMFQLWGWERIRPTGAPSFGMRAIVGRALRTRTPVLVEEMRYVVFRPYWNVPRSILRHESLPILERDLGYLRRQNMEIVRGLGDDAKSVIPSAENVALLTQGLLRLRQRPGPGNALGLIKFVFPNDENVYLHGTPAQELFDRTRRDFSHGCVRVEDPVALAAWVLRDQPGWDTDRILTAMSGTRSRRVALTRPIPVILFYITAVVMPEDGTIRFAEDIYGHDTRLDQAMAHQSHSISPDPSPAVGNSSHGSKEKSPSDRAGK